jgi:hypothetical protein
LAAATVVGDQADASAARPTAPRYAAHYKELIKTGPTSVKKV